MVCLPAIISFEQSYSCLVDAAASSIDVVDLEWAQCKLVVAIMANGVLTQLPPPYAMITFVEKSPSVLGRKLCKRRQSEIKLTTSLH